MNERDRIETVNEKVLKEKELRERGVGRREREINGGRGR
tara:strand:+ start:583 stop:699 length:117 start_codon:yes stop_codon:yes gene_type:complete